jgi:hypothetical protein
MNGLISPDLFTMCSRVSTVAIAQSFTVPAIQSVATCHAREVVVNDASTQRLGEYSLQSGHGTCVSYWTQSLEAWLPAIQPESRSIFQDPDCYIGDGNCHGDDSCHDICLTSRPHTIAVNSRDRTKPEGITKCLNESASSISSNGSVPTSEPYPAATKPDGTADEIAKAYMSVPTSLDIIGDATHHDANDTISGAVFRDSEVQHHRSKDAGKTCKERFSYSSFDAGATILKTNVGTQNAKAILVENKDSYLLMECAAMHKYVIIELSDDILVDTVVLANFEFFSSMIRHFRVSVSDRYPAKLERWKDLGTFEAKNSRDIQPFLVNNPQIWAKYVRIEFISHYGNEFYCPLSLVRIHGTRMIESWQDSEREDEEDEENNGGDDDIGLAPVPSPESIISIDSIASSRNVIQSFRPVIQPPKQCDESHINEMHITCPIRHIEWSSIFTSPAWQTCLTTTVPNMSVNSQVDHNEARCSKISTAGPAIFSTTNTLSDGKPPEKSSILTHTSAHSQHSDHYKPIDTYASDVPTRATDLLDKTKPVMTSTTNPHVPVVQESFFKSITKRLQALENNMTSSVRYIHDESQRLADTMDSVETALLQRLHAMALEVNATLHTDLRKLYLDFRDTYNLMAVALESQNERSEREIVAIGTRLNLLADEVIFQRRMAITQAFILLSCLVLIIFMKGVNHPQASTGRGQRNVFSLDPSSVTLTDELSHRTGPSIML